MTKERYNVVISYCAGKLYTDKCFNTEEDARAFTEEYKNNFEEVNKYYSIDRIIYTTEKKLFKTTTTSRTEHIESWFEE